MPSSNTPSSGEKQQAATRGQHARRFARVGMLVGAVIGLGGGLAGVLKFAFFGAISGAVAGGVAGKKLAPLADRISSFLPGRGKKEPKQALAFAPVREQAPVHAPSAPVSPSAVGTGAGYQEPGSIDPDVLAELREGISGAVTKVRTGANAEAGMLKEGGVAPGGWVDAVSNKRPTHPAHLTYQ